jgi:hypothetical protein
MSRLARLARLIVVPAVVLVAAAGCGENRADDRADDTTASSDTTAVVPFDWSVEIDDEWFDLVLRLPTEPERIVQPVQLPDGTRTELVVYTATEGEREVFVSVLPLDPDDYDLDAAAPGAATGVAGVLVEVSRVEVDGNPARDAEIRIEGAAGEADDQLLLYRAVLLDQGLLQLQSLGPAGDRAWLERAQATLVDGVTFR